MSEGCQSCAWMSPGDMDSDQRLAHGAVVGDSTYVSQAAIPALSHRASPSPTHLLCSTCPQTPLHPKKHLYCYPFTSKVSLMEICEPSRHLLLPDLTWACSPAPAGFPRNPLDNSSKLTP